ncbi:MAG: hypothetical protein ACYTF0_08105, partial [Planctomycetota bacterium]
MRQLSERYHDDHRVAALHTALEADDSLTIGAVHGGLIPILLAALWQRCTATRPALIVGPDPAALRDDLDDLGVPAVLLPELDEHEA